MNKKRLEILAHSSVIIGALILINIPGFDLRIGVFRTGDGTFIVPSIVGTAINCIIFYGNSELLIPRLLSNNRRGKYLVLLCALFIGVSTVESVTDYVLASYLNIHLERQGAHFRLSTVPAPDGSLNRVLAKEQSGVGEIISTVLVFNALTLLASFAYKFSKDWLHNERMKRTMAEDKLSAELAFLKSQINPHFLFNTLNNLFSMALQSNDHRTAEGISQLASLMRYMLYESNSTTIYLEKELAYIHNYIGLQKLRLAQQENITIEYVVRGNPDGVALAPMFFIPFIENAFKHGISMNTPSRIHIMFDVQKTTVDFCISNTINRLNRMQHQEASGVGLNNVRRRLALLYPGNHELQIHDDGTTFEVRLRLTAIQHSPPYPVL